MRWRCHASQTHRVATAAPCVPPSLVITLGDDGDSGFYARLIDEMNLWITNCTYRGWVILSIAKQTRIQSPATCPFQPSLTRRFNTPSPRATYSPCKYLSIYLHRGLTPPLKIFRKKKGRKHLFFGFWLHSGTTNIKTAAGNHVFTFATL